MRQSSRIGVSLLLAMAGCRDAEPTLRTTNTQNQAQRPANGSTDTPAREDASAADVQSAVAPEVPGGTAPVAGPTGTIEGIVRIEGPLPVAQPQELASAFSGKRGCPDAARRYAHAFDVSEPGPIGGALVTVEARAPGLGPSVTRRISVRDCDVVQRYLFAKENDVIELEAIGQGPHLPVIVGTGETINQLLIPNQAPRRLVFNSPGQYPITFRDLPPFVGAMIYRLRQRFIDTTDVQGHFRINEVPVGDTVIVHAWIPGAIESRETVAVRAGETTRVEFRLRPAPVARQRVQGTRQSDGTVRTPDGRIIPQ